MKNRKNPKKMIEMMTTMVVLTTSLREGQVTFWSSARTSFRKAQNRLYHLIFSLIFVDVLRMDLAPPGRPGPGGRLAGEAGLEPATCGFGDRCSNQLSYSPVRGTGPPVTI